MAKIVTQNSFQHTLTPNTSPLMLQHRAEPFFMRGCSFQRQVLPLFSIYCMAAQIGRLSELTSGRQVTAGPLNIIFMETSNMWVLSWMQKVTFCGRTYWFQNVFDSIVVRTHHTHTYTLHRFREHKKINAKVKNKILTCVVYDKYAKVQKQHVIFLKNFTQEGKLFDFLHTKLVPN